MVTKKQPAPAPAVGITCTVTDVCSDPATLQATRSCDSCGEETATLRSAAQSRRRQLDECALREAAVKEAARGRAGLCGCGDPHSHDGSAEGSDGKPTPCPRPQSGELTELEAFDLRLIAGNRQDAGTNLEQLEAAIAGVAREHTHPVFACKKHEKQLPA